MADAEIKLTKNQFIPFIDTSETIHSGTWTPTWKRIDKSTIFDLNPNAQTKELDYISQELPTEEIESYKPELPQEIALYAGNPIYDFVFNRLYGLHVGDAAIAPVLLCFPGTTTKKAWQIQRCVLVPGNLNTVDGKLSFSLKFGGDIERGTYTITEGAPTFSKASS